VKINSLGSSGKRFGNIQNRDLLQSIRIIVKRNSRGLARGGCLVGGGLLTIGGHLDISMGRCPSRNRGLVDLLDNKTMRTENKKNEK
jgi:hypothetical protein